jgi:murein DD-endopeptidase MepM/ murein hydrolase activator NlpD
VQPGVWDGVRQYGRRVRAVTRAQVLLFVVAVTSIAAGAVAVAQTTDTTPDRPTSAPPTSVPEPSTTTTSTTTTTTRPSTTTSTTPPGGAAPSAPADRVSVPTAAEDAAARAAFAVLTDSQRLLLRRLQATRDDLSAARVKVVALTAHLDTARARLADAEHDVEAAEHDVARATRELDRLHAEMTELANAMYQHLGGSVVLDTVNTADRNEVNRVRTYAEAPQDVLNTLVARTSETKGQLADARARAAAARTAAATVLSTVQSTLAKQHDAFTAAEGASSAAVTAVSEALGSNVALLALVADPHFGADAITAALAVAQAGAGEPVTRFGAFRLPVPGAALGSPYGTRVDPLTGSIGYHPGVDFEAPAGAEVHAAAPGTVVMAGDCGGYGNCVVIDHGHSLATVSAHLSRTLVTAGQPVLDGQVVGLVGSTGRSTGPHLHFEVRLHGAPIDPIPTITA